ncbi:MAG: lipase secretion chaperone, partial [Myxococcota bacterium]
HGTAVAAPEGPAALGAMQNSNPDDVAAAAPARSLRGTETDGRLVTDAAGFVPTPDALRLFDYFFSASGEEPAEQIIARIEEEIHRLLPDPAAAADARVLLGRYLAYRDSARALDTAGYAPDDLERRIQLLRELRRDAFGAELAAALFGEEDLEREVAAEQTRVAQDPALSDAERQERLDELERRMPQGAREAREESTVALELRTEEARWRADDAGAAEIQALRERRVGPEAAERLAALDVRRTAWSARLAEYHAERDALESDASLDRASRYAAVEALQERRFSRLEIARVRALDRIEASAPDARR